MRRETLYSRSSRSQPAGRPSPEKSPDDRVAPASDSVDQPRGNPPAEAQSWRSRLSVPKIVKRHERPALLAVGGLLALLLVALHAAMQPPSREITQGDIDAAVLHTLETKPLPSAAARAYEIIRPSVVRVRGLGYHDSEKDADTETGVGSGVVIVDKGIILTNVHVVAGARRVKVVFADGLESDATVVGLQPEQDLAVLQAATIPDDLVPATLRSTSDLAPGDEVIAVGFPFGIGPTVSAGVVSGLRREFLSPQGKQLLTNLIQFDAAANPGSSGGPLVTTDGAVVGIVTAILNPTAQRVFVGIGFAVPIESAASAVGIPPF
ncbi:MAG TPA: trypsin-like peptidase domain-containing protein [Candidatus Methylomirabilis sp.]|nr:trypsin-like peptidase domain-containing protein [Candidatus Methylomirabilis sp.]